jgi:putative peptidoglycan lipid II flippase
MVAGAFLMCGTDLIDQSMAAMLGPGSVSALNYGNKIVAFMHGIGAFALSTAALPYFSRMVAVDDWTGVRNNLKIYTNMILWVTVPVTVIGCVLSEYMVMMLFERGAFSNQDTGLVGQIQRLYLLQVPFYMLSILTVRLISSLKANHVLMWGAAINLLLNVILNYVFMLWIGISGIALSTSAVYLVSFCFLRYQLSRLMKRVPHDIYRAD